MTLVVHNSKLGTLSAGARKYLGRGRVKFERNAITGQYSVKPVSRGGHMLNSRGGVYLTDLREMLNLASMGDDQVLVFDLQPNTENGRRLVLAKVQRRPKERRGESDIEV